MKTKIYLPKKGYKKIKHGMMGWTDRRLDGKTIWLEVRK